MNDPNKPLGNPTFIQLCCENFGYLENRIRDSIPKKELKKLEKKFAKRRHTR
jgi:hypothetical protein